VSDEARTRILEMLEAGKITAAEASELLSALDGRAPQPGSGLRRRVVAEVRAQWFNVRVTDRRTGETRANVRVPLGMVGFGLGAARRFAPKDARFDDIFEAVRSGRRGPVFDVEGEGERVEILID
jgi:hypothetical protein